MFYRGVGVVCLGFMVALSPRSGALGAESPDSAEKLIRHGIELRKAHDDEGAAREFQKAYDDVHTPRAAGQLGLAEQALGRWEDAERHVGEALHAAGDAWVVKNRAILDEALGTIQTHLARIEVIGDPEGADVSVNGRVVGKLPLGEAVRVSAGEVEVELHAPGHVPTQRTLTMVGGQYQRVVLHLVKEASAGDATPGTTIGGEQRPQPGSASIMPLVATSSPAEARTPARTAIKWSAAGLAGIGLVVGIVATIAHGNNVSAFDNHTPSCADNNGTAVHQNGSAAPECQGSLDSYRSDTTWAIVGFAGAGAFAVTWLILQLTQGGHPAAAEHARAAPLCAPSLSGLGLSCELRF
jgi:PEGA domain